MFYGFGSSTVRCEAAPVANHITDCAIGCQTPTCRYICSLSPTIGVTSRTNLRYGGEGWGEGACFAPSSTTSNQPFWQLSIRPIQPLTSVKSQSCDNLCKHPSQVPHHVVIRHTHNLPASSPNRSFTLLIGAIPPGMAVAINFDNKLSFDAGKVDDLGADRELPAKF